MAAPRDTSARERPPSGRRHDGRRAGLGPRLGPRLGAWAVVPLCLVAGLAIAGFLTLAERTADRHAVAFAELRGTVRASGAVATADASALAAERGAADTARTRASLATWVGVPALLLACGLGIAAGARRRRRLLLASLEATFTQRVRTLMWTLNDVVLEVDRQGRILFVTPSADRVLGRRAGELVGRHVADVLPVLDANLCDRAAASRPGQPVHLELELERPDGTMAVGEVTGSPGIDGSVWVWRDVNERRSLEAQLEHQSGHDPLTGLLTREGFRDRVVRAAVTDRSHRMAVAVVDLDGFKAVNHGYGHAAGDEVLRIMGDRATLSLGRTGIVGRLGGDEFLAAFPVQDDAHVQAVAGALVEVLTQPISVGGRPTRIGVSIGVATSGATVDVDRLLQRAASAKDEAKSRGGGWFEATDASERPQR